MLTALEVGARLETVPPLELEGVRLLWALKDGSLSAVEVADMQPQIVDAANALYAHAKNVEAIARTICALKPIPSQAIPNGF